MNLFAKIFASTCALLGAFFTVSRSTIIKRRAKRGLALLYKTIPTFRRGLKDRFAALRKARTRHRVGIFGWLDRRRARYDAHIAVENAFETHLIRRRYNEKKFPPTETRFFMTVQDRLLSPEDFRRTLSLSSVFGFNAKKVDSYFPWRRFLSTDTERINKLNIHRLIDEAIDPLDDPFVVEEIHFKGDDSEADTDDEYDHGPREIRPPDVPVRRLRPLSLAEAALSYKDGLADWAKDAVRNANPGPSPLNPKYWETHAWDTADTFDHASLTKTGVKLAYEKAMEYPQDESTMKALERRYHSECIFDASDAGSEATEIPPSLPKIVTLSRPPTPTFTLPPKKRKVPVGQSPTEELDLSVQDTLPSAVTPTRPISPLPERVKTPEPPASVASPPPPPGPPPPPTTNRGPPGPPPPPPMAQFALPKDRGIPRLPPKGKGSRFAKLAAAAALEADSGVVETPSTQGLKSSLPAPRGSLPEPSFPPPPPAPTAKSGFGGLEEVPESDFHHETSGPLGAEHVTIEGLSFLVSDLLGEDGSFDKVRIGEVVKLALEKRKSSLVGLPSPTLGPTSKSVSWADQMESESEPDVPGSLDPSRRASIVQRLVDALEARKAASTGPSHIIISDDGVDLHCGVDWLSEALADSRTLSLREIPKSTIERLRTAHTGYCIPEDDVLRIFWASWVIWQAMITTGQAMTPLPRYARVLVHPKTADRLGVADGHNLVPFTFLGFVSLRDPSPKGYLLDAGMIDKNTKGTVINSRMRVLDYSFFGWESDDEKMEWIIPLFAPSFVVRSHEFTLG